MKQVIQITVDLDKVVEAGTIIMAIGLPKKEAPNGAVFVHDPLGLPGWKFKEKQDGEPGALSIVSKVFDLSPASENKENSEN